MPVIIVFIFKPYVVVKGLFNPKFISYYFGLQFINNLLLKRKEPQLLTCGGGGGGRTYFVWGED